MATRLPETAYAVGSSPQPRFNWRESNLVAQHGWTQSISLGHGNSSTAITIDIAGGDALRNLPSDVLGYSKKQGDTIARQIPWRHPLFRSMYATKILHIEGLGWKGIDHSGNGPISEYEMYHVTIGYETPPWDVYADGAKDEWDRNIIKEVEPTYEFITRQTGTFQYPPAASLPPAYAKIGGTTFAGGKAQIVQKLRLMWTWVDVPDNGLFSNGGSANNGAPTNILKTIGRVNDEEFAGYPAGTLFFESPRFIARSQPVDPDYMGQDKLQSPRSWDVIMCMVYFDPEPVDANKRGHNLVPNQIDNKWIRAFMAGGSDTGDYWRYRTAKFSDAFHML